ncbi:hypothetical protein EXW35_06580 [Bacillus mycoides]|uniref:hypothetical protein n=1 Tax=Bacillus mycoides TaxID=1405 RepID=UPI001C027A64|nr:hypothetical protein [Bacillus mycoides]QWG38116.1 hypothetical protein EXW35_06580 [Bacillus mycoides]
MPTAPTSNQDETKKRDEKAKVAGYMVALSGTLYTLTLSKTSCVYIDYINGFWTAWRESHWNTDKQPSSVKIIAKAATFDYVLMKTKGYLDFIKKIKQ